MSLVLTKETTETVQKWAKSRGLEGKDAADKLIHTGIVRLAALAKYAATHAKPKTSRKAKKKAKKAA
jgi:hypothetical protein